MTNDFRPCYISLHQYAQSNLKRLELIFVYVHTAIIFPVVKLCVLLQGQDIRQIFDISCFVGIYINKAY